MQVTLTQNVATTPVRQPSILSRSSSTAGHAAGTSSARLSAHLRTSLLQTPPGRPYRTSAVAAGVGAGDGTAPPLLPSFESHPLPSSSGRFERQQSGRHALGSRSDEETVPTIDLEFIGAEADALANAMSREELEKSVNELRTENRMLQSTILVEREDLARLQEGLRETYETAEKEGESITNQLMRRVDAARRQKSQLEARLHEEEKMKMEQEQKLVQLKLNSSNLARRLQREEEGTLTTMKKQLQQLQKQRQHLESLLSEQSSSVHQLQELVDVLQKQSDEVSGSNPAPAAGTLGDSDLMASADAPTASASSDTVPLQSPATEHADPASNPHEMLQYLMHEVKVVEGLQREAFERGVRYEQKRQELERRIRQAERERNSNRHSLEGIHQELVETTATVTELASAAEMAMEVEIDRQIHACSRPASVNSSMHESLTPLRRARTPSERISESLSATEAFAKTTKK